MYVMYNYCHVVVKTCSYTASVVLLDCCCCCDWCVPYAGQSAILILSLFNSKHAVSIVVINSSIIIYSNLVWLGVSYITLGGLHHFK